MGGFSESYIRSRNWFRNHPWTTTFITLVFTLAFVRWYSAGEPAEDTKLIRATVERGNIEELVPAAGRVEPVSYVDVGAQVSGQLQALHVVVGQTVEKGPLLAEIDASVQANPGRSKPGQYQGRRSAVVSRGRPL